MAKREPSEAKLPTRSRCFCAGPHPEPAGSLAQHSCTHLETRPAGALRGVPGDARASACGSSLWPLPPLGSPPTPDAEVHPAGGQGGPLAAPGTVLLGKLPAPPSLWSAGPSSPSGSRRGVVGNAGSPRRTRVCKTFSKALASQPLKIRARAEQEEPVRARAALGEGPGARFWPAARRVQTGPRQPNPVVRAKGPSQR